MTIVTYSPDNLAAIARVAAEKGRIVAAAQIHALRLKLIAAGVVGSTDIAVSEKMASALFANGG